MTQQQFIEEIKRLSIAERIALMEAITHSLREDIENDKNSMTADKEIRETDVRNERQRKVAAVERLRGIIKFDGEAPTDEELKEDYANYLAEKYS